MLIKLSVIKTLMFIPCIIRCIRKDQHFALICTTPSFYILASTCFGSSLPSSGSFLDPPELLEIQIECVVISYNVWLRDLCVGLPWFGLLCLPTHELGDTTDRTMVIRHIGHVTTHYMIYHPLDLYFK
jgi:hypothetical protein